jgi:hypothetical protein
MDEIISYKMCAVKVRNAKLRNYLKIVCKYNTPHLKINPLYFYKYVVLNKFVSK